MNARAFAYNAFTMPTRFLANLLDPPAVILLYHRVTTLEHDPERLAVTPSHFDAHLSFLKSHYSVLTVDEFVASLARGSFPRRSVLLTFDDGYADNCLEALPLLEASGLQALFYVTTALIGANREFWWDELEKATAGLPGAQLDLMVRGRKITFQWNTDGERAQSYAGLHHIIKYLDAESRETVLQQVLEAAHIPRACRPDHRIMTADELKKLSSSPSAVIGAHTHHHVPLRILGREEQRQEIDHSRSILERLTDKKVDHFSYPYGLRKDYTRETMDVCREMNFSMVCANYHGQVHRWTSRYELPRIIVRNWPLPEFERRMRRFFLL